MKFKEMEFAQKFFCRGFWRWMRFSPLSLDFTQRHPLPHEDGGKGGGWVLHRSVSIIMATCVDPPA